MQIVYAPFNNEGPEGFFHRDVRLFAKEDEQSFQHIRVCITAKVNGIALSELISRNGGMVSPMGMGIIGQPVGRVLDEQFHPVPDAADGID